MAKKIIGLEKRFLWGGKDGKKYLTTVKWKTLAAPKDYGGFGIGDIRMKNLDSLLKWWWRYSISDNPLWKRVVMSTHCFNNRRATFNEFQTIQGTFNEVVSWRNKIPWLKDSITINMEVKIGNGSTVLFWHGIWVGNQALKILFPRLFNISTQKEYLVIDMRVWDGISRI